MGEPERVTESLEHLRQLGRLALVQRSGRGSRAAGGILADHLKLLFRHTSMLKYLRETVRRRYAAAAVKVTEGGTA
ncbi:hypothetical protein SSP24_67250 [Streptomyces spinoverrucosus]|uniref:Uncharacterized protein n=1 Tax=Streptomyces spinoverrucosus TaxID=284043 RepID=A0A4Y3VTV5_9ACTN|nr:hypothetical protein SSP24_67250 [Streptomyces spinoverrucosus]GHB93712.1 hypothetical protein GCM10010397_78150 [Streptomyces spinoverrucosus]